MKENKKDTQNVFVLLNIQFYPSDKDDIFVNDDYSSMVHLELQIFPKEVDDKIPIMDLEDGKPAFNQINGDEVHIYRLKKTKDTDNWFVLEMSACNNDIEYRLINDISDTSKGYTDLFRHVQNGRYVTYMPYIKKLNYIEVKNKPSNHKNKNFTEQYDYLKTEYWMKYFSVHNSFIMRRSAPRNGTFN